VPASAIGEQFRKTVVDRGTRVAVRMPANGSATFADLADAAAAVSRALTAIRVARGAVVVSIVANGPMFFALFAACMDEGVALIPVGQATAMELTTLIEQAGAAAVITDRELPIEGVREERVAAGVSIVRLRDPGDPPRHGESVVLKLTSGSTSAPRAAVASEQHLINDGRHIVDAMGIAAADVNAAYTPLSHSYAIGNIVIPLLCQGTGAAVYPSFNPLQFVQDVLDSGATVFPGVPFMFERIKSAGIDRLPDCLRLLITAGAAIDGAVVAWFRERLDRKVHSFYGSSETGGISYDDSEAAGDVVSVGTALPETTIRMRDIRADGTGRVFVSGNAVSSGYAGVDDAAPIAEFADGGFLTADLGRFDEDGRLVLAGRVSPVVNVAGRKVDPYEVERCLLAVPGIAASTVMGLDCDRRGQELVAFVVRDDARLTAVQIRTACATTLSPHKLPRRIVFLERLPVTERGKIDRVALRQLAGGA